MHYPRLDPVVAPWISNLISQKEALKRHLTKFGSPVHIHNPVHFTKNIKLFKVVLNKCGIPFRIYFARKSNKAKVYIRQARKMRIGVDTASSGELMQCLKAGLDPKDVTLTAAIKNERLLTLAVKNGVLVIVDNYDELGDLDRIAKRSNVGQKFGIRVSGFSYKKEKLYSRFGFDIDRLDDVFEKIRKNAYPNLTFSGFHFHLTGYLSEQRAEAIIQIIKVVQKLKRFGIRTSFIDIGGGFTVNYLKSYAQWTDFRKKLQMAVLQKIPQITFENDGLGYGRYKNKLLGKENFYPYYNTLYKEKFLQKILSYKAGKGETVADLIRGANLELRIEPGRSLLDQCGITIARVVFRKTDQNNDWLVGLEMNTTQLHSSSVDFLLDPKIIYLGKKYETKSVSCWFVGNYCLEKDVILKRKIELFKLPQIGDLVCFVNTAAYMMHFFESKGHQFGIAKNFVVQGGTKRLVLAEDA